MLLPQLFIRADATTKIGTGHLMRCLSLAQAWSKKGGCVTFLSHCENEALMQRINEEGFRIIYVEHPDLDSAGLKNDLCLIRKAQNSNDNCWLVLDGYHFDFSYQESIRNAGIKLLVIDDYNHLPCYCADILLNQNIGAEKIPYTIDPKTVCLFGTKYTLLRNEFLDWNCKIKKKTERVSNILVTLGGSDPDNITLKVIQTFLQAGLKDIKINVVVGPANPNTEVLENEIRCAVKAKIPTAANLSLHKSANIPELMDEADFAITAGGSTCWELCFFGLPFIVIVTAENQRDVVSELDRVGAAVSLGWHENVELADFAIAIRELIYDTDKLWSMSQAARKIVDGHGCERILTMMDWIQTASDKSDFQMRKADEEDRHQLWMLANEKEVRCNSFREDPISYDEHIKWFREKLESNSSIIYVLDVSGVLLSQVRYDRKDGFAEIDYAVIPGFREKGLGTKILKATWEMACRELGVERVCGIVKEENKASICSFLKAGFEKTGSHKYSGVNCVFFEKKL